MKAFAPLRLVDDSHAALGTRLPSDGGTLKMRRSGVQLHIIETEDVVEACIPPSEGRETWTLIVLSVAWLPKHQCRAKFCPLSVSIVAVITSIVLPSSSFCASISSARITRLVRVAVLDSILAMSAPTALARRAAASSASGVMTPARTATAPSSSSPGS